MTAVGGIEYVTTAEAIERLGSDITGDTIRGWVRQGRLKPAGRLSGGPWIFRWSEVVEAEYETRKSRRGRPRRPCAPSANLHIAGQLHMSTAARKLAS